MNQSISKTADEKLKKELEEKGPEEIQRLAQGFVGGDLEFQEEDEDESPESGPKVQ
jgi:hypothetical protein